jgi:hypothetical protein
MSVFQRKKSIFSKRKNGVWIILPENSSVMRELNEVAGDIWAMLKQPCSEDLLIDTIASKYNENRSVIQKDVHVFLALYEKDGLIERINTQ